MTTKIDPSELSFTKNDNYSVVDFLSSTASVLAASELIGQKDLDNVRVALSGIQSDNEMRELPLLLCLIEQNAEIVKIIAMRYGTERFSLNLLRYTMRSILAETTSILGVWGEQLLSKAELLFNRPFVVMGVDQKPLRRMLYSQVLVDFAGVLAEACKELTEVRAALSYIHGADFAAMTDEDKALDQTIAESLGMAGIKTDPNPYADELTLKERVSRVVERVAEYTAEVFNQISFNTNSPANTHALMGVERLRADAQRLIGLRFTTGGSLPAWEARRISVLSSLHTVNAAAAALATTSLSAIGKGTEAKPMLPWQIPANVNRRVTADLVAGGVSINKAEDAVTMFNNYCRDRNIGPKDILPGELAKISIHLLPRSLTLFHKLNAESTVESVVFTTEDKRITLEKSQRLMKGFKTTLASLLTFFAVIGIGLTNSGCGIKTSPKSDVVDFRPDIPYRNAASTLPALPPSPLPNSNAPQAKPR